MLNVFVADPRGCLVKAEAAPDGPLPAAAVWIDLLEPTPTRRSWSRPRSASTCRRARR